MIDRKLSIVTVAIIVILSLFVYSMASLFVYSYVYAQKTLVHPIFVWQPSKFVGQLLAIDRPDSTVKVTVELNIIHNSTYGKESFTIGELNYLRGQQMSLEVWSTNYSIANPLATYVVPIPNSPAGSLPVV